MKGTTTMTQPGGDSLALLERALDQATGVVGGVRPEQMGLPTPCEEWDVRRLLAHMGGGLRRTLANVSGEPPPPAAAEDVMDGATYGAMAQALLAAWRRPGALERTYHLPFGDLPGPAFAGFGAMEAVIHTWDLAKATGQTGALDPQLAEIALGMVMQRIPAERGAEMPFKSAVPVPADAPAYDRLAGYLGRQP
jgi:uncharacterized protein (TIGR03086 family)